MELTDEHRYHMKLVAAAAVATSLGIKGIEMEPLASIEELIRTKDSAAYRLLADFFSAHDSWNAFHVAREADGTRDRVVGPELAKLVELVTKRDDSRAELIRWLSSRD